MKAYLHTLAVALSVLANALAGGAPTETISYRSAKARRAGRRWGCILCRVLDRIEAGHCDRALNWWERPRQIDTDEQGQLP